MELSPRQQRVLDEIAIHLRETIVDTATGKKTTAEKTDANGTPEKKPAKRPQNNEIQLLARIDRILSEQTPELAKRAIAWFASREFGGNWTMLPPEAKP